MPGPGIEPPTSGVPSGCANHYTTAPLILSGRQFNRVGPAAEKINSVPTSHYQGVSSIELDLAAEKINSLPISHYPEDSSIELDRQQKR